MFFQSSNKLRKRTHHSGILHFAGTCFHVKVSLVKFIECACFMLLHVASWCAAVGLLTQVSHQGNKRSCRLHLEALEVCGNRRMQR